MVVLYNMDITFKTGLLAVILASLTPAAQSKRIYLIAVGPDYGAQQYIGDKGYLTGFAQDLIPEVCQAAEVDCRLVFDGARKCWNSEAGQRSHAGEGLHDGWFDGCSGWDATIERIHTFAFSNPYTRTIRSYFYHRKGETFDVGNLKDKKIGFVQGWASSEKCLARQDVIQNNVLNDGQIFYFSTATDLLQGIRNRSVDAGFGDSFTFTDEVINQYLSFDQNRPFTCILAGNSIMTRKDSDLPTVWNIGFYKIRNTGRYRKICKEGQKRHGHRGSVDCLES